MYTLKKRFLVTSLVTIWSRKPLNAGIVGSCPGSIPRRSRHLKKPVSANILSFTDDKLKYYEQIPVQFNALESTQSLPIWSRFGHLSNQVIIWLIPCLTSATISPRWSIVNLHSLDKLLLFCKARAPSKFT